MTERDFGTNEIMRETGNEMLLPSRAREGRSPSSGEGCRKRMGMIKQPLFASIP